MRSANIELCYITVLINRVNGAPSRAINSSCSGNLSEDNIVHFSPPAPPAPAPASPPPPSAPLPPPPLPIPSVAMTSFQSRIASADANVQSYGSKMLPEC